MFERTFLLNQNLCQQKKTVRKDVLCQVNPAKFAKVEDMADLTFLCCLSVSLFLTACALNCFFTGSFFLYISGDPTYIPWHIFV